MSGIGAHSSRKTKRADPLSSPPFLASGSQGLTVGCYLLEHLLGKTVCINLAHNLTGGNDEPAAGLLRFGERSFAGERSPGFCCWGVRWHRWMEIRGSSQRSGQHLQCSFCADSRRRLRLGRLRRAAPGWLPFSTLGCLLVTRSGVRVQIWDTTSGRGRDGSCNENLQSQGRINPGTCP